ncbi:DMT family transporter [Tropicimonas sp. TH_r6]|uniref:DMT family transporter n=1 Tax=Tropicimonas sp. TH_r6 TaxID=3082085 RepID=UPI002952C099|nr:DMT family transporter [Tropicimonas sp. TH_r6]MDV7141125.1 DMT family transporter [Tropicimonas sp. TH_r6]
MAFAVAFYTCIDSSAKWLNLIGMPVMQIVFFRYAGHFVYSLLLYVPQDGRDAFRSNAPRLQLFRSFFLLASTMLNFIALKYLPLTITTAVAFASPIVVTLLGIPLLGEKVGIRRIIAVFVGFSGVLVVVQPWGESFNPAIFFSLASLLSVALYFIMTRMLAGVETNAVQQIWSSGLATLVLLPIVLRVWAWPDSPTVWAVCIAIGGFGMFGHSITAVAHRWADASVLAPMMYLQIFYASFAGIMLFNTWPTVWTLVGGVIIAASGLYIWHRTKAEAREAALRASLGQ